MRYDCDCEECQMSRRLTSEIKLKRYIVNTLNRNISEDRSIKILKWAIKKKIVSRFDYCILNTGKASLKISAFRCQRSQKWYSTKENSINVYTKVGNRKKYVTWHYRFVSEAFYCNSHGYRYDRRKFTPIIVDDIEVCQEETRLFTWGDGSVHLNQETDGVVGYHRSPKPWRENAVKGLVFGCELEILAKDSRKEINLIAQECGLYTERDGSIDEERGIEIIGAPESLEAHQDPDGKWMKFLNKVQGKAYGWNAGDNYGLHVSFNKLALRDYHTGKMLVFIHHNRNLCETIAGRKQNRWAQYVDKKIIDGTQNSEINKYESLAIRSVDRMECRIFRSTLKPAGFLRGVEFVASAVEFTRHASAKNLTENAYKEWLKKNTRNYKNLSRHLGILGPVKVAGKEIKKVEEIEEIA